MTAARVRFFGLVLTLIGQVSMLWLVSGQLSPTPDESAHLAAGVSYWRSGSLKLYNVNPPLARIWFAWPLYWRGIELPVVEGSEKIELSARREFLVGDELEKLPQFFEWLVMARRMNLVFALLGTCGVLSLTTLVFDECCGLIAAVIWAFNPIVLGHGAVLATDIPGASMGVWSLVGIFIAYRSGKWRHYALLGVLFALGILTKFSLIVFPFVWALSMLALGCARKTKFTDIGEQSTHGLWKCSLAIAILMCIVSLGYKAHGLFVPLNEFSFVSEGMQVLAKSGDRSIVSACNRLPMPLPAAMLEGLDQQWQDFDDPRPCYLAGKWKSGGWWYYYVVALAIKLPLGLIVLLFPASILAFKRWATLFLVTVFGVALILVSSKSNMNEHCRYLWIVLPILCTLSVSTYYCFGWFGKCLALSCAVWIAAVGLMSVPFGISYSNELAGGMHSTWRYLAGSNTDWRHGWIAGRETLPLLAENANVGLLPSRYGAVAVPGLLTSALPSFPERCPKTLLVLSTDDRMELQRAGLLLGLNPTEENFVGCCLEVYEKPFTEVQELEGITWVVKR